MSDSRSPDPVALTVFSNRCRAAAEAMAFTLYRTAYSTFVKETEDFTTGLATAAGQTFASPRELGATWFTGLDYGSAIAKIDAYREGDICITNDPYSGFVSTHVPDIHLWKPVFCNGRVVCFAVSHIHNTDMGGAVPASLSRTLTEIHQEGIRIPPRKLVSAGGLDQSLLDVMLANVRNPEQNWGDLKAQIAAVNTGEQKLLEIIEKLGPEGFQSNVDALLDLAERQARNLLTSVPDGDYAFSDFIDEDSVNGLPCRLHLTLRIRGDEAVLDFTGSDPQAESSINLPTGGHERHALLMVGVIYILYCLDPTIQLNSGLMRPFKAIAPLGTVLNAEFPAAVGLRSITCVRLMGVVQGAFSLALPGRLPAAASSGGPIVNVQTFDPTTGQRRMASIGPVTGGSGGSPNRDGPEASGGTNGFLKNTPVEVNETELPIRFRRYGLAPDSGGAGLHRGGMATTIELEVLTPGTRITARNRDRSKFNCWGAQGGRAGMPSAMILNPGTANESDLGNTDVLVMQPGDVLRITAGGSGGWGNPFLRDTASVERDVRRGFITDWGAREGYGVVVRDGRVDLAGTKALREGNTPDQAISVFDLGPRRRVFECVWDERAYAELTRILARLPAPWRFFVKHKLFAEISRSVGRGDNLDVPARLQRAFDELLAGMPTLDQATGFAA